MLFGLLPLAFLGFIIWWALSTRSRVYKLERRLTHIEQYLQKETSTLEREAHSTEPKREDVQHMSEKIAEEVYPDQKPPKTAQPGSLENFGTWLKEDWLMKLGGFLLILALAWFVHFAFEQGWVGPVGKIGIGVMAGISVLALGRYRIATFPSQGGILMFVGALGVILTLWAARNYYDFFTPGSALILMFLVSAVLGVTSVQFNRYPLAYANVILGAIAPLLVASGNNSFVGLYSYLFVLTLGSIWVAIITGWRQLILSSLIIVFLYSLPFMASYSAEVEAWGLITMYAFAAMFFFTSILGTNKNRIAQVSDLFTAIISAILLFIWTLDQVDNESWASVLLMVWTVVYAFGSFTALRIGARIEYFFTYLGVGTFFLGVATALLLEGEVLTIAYMLEATVILYIGHMITRKATHLVLLSLPWIVPILLALQSLDMHEWRDGIFHSHAFVVYLLIFITGVLAKNFGDKMRATIDNEPERILYRNMRNLFLIVAATFATITAWIIPHALFDGDAGTTIALLVYTFAGIYFYVMGNQSGKMWEKVLAGFYLAIVVGHILFIDIWEMSEVMRVLTLFIIGSLLVLVAWIERNSFKKVSDTSQNINTQE